MVKTIVFCATEDAAERMRMAEKKSPDFELCNYDF